MKAGPGAAQGQGPVTLDTVRALNEGESLYLGEDGQKVEAKMKARRPNFEESWCPPNPGGTAQLLNLLPYKYIPDFPSALLWF